MDVQNITEAARHNREKYNGFGATFTVEKLAEYDNYILSCMIYRIVHRLRLLPSLETSAGAVSVGICVSSSLWLG